jgi:hypothetical protein
MTNRSRDGFILVSPPQLSLGVSPGQFWSFVVVLTHRFVFTKDVYYLCTNKANWSIVSDSDGNFFFTKEVSYLWTNNA